MGLSPVKRFTIADGDLGTSQTIDKIRKLVHDGMTDQYVNRMAMPSCARPGSPSSTSRVRYARSTTGCQQTSALCVTSSAWRRCATPREILTTRAGDCDDINATLLPALLMTVGAHVRLVTISSDARDPNTFTHIYLRSGRSTR